MMRDIENKINDIDLKIDNNRKKIKSVESRDAFQKVFDEKTLNLLNKQLFNGKITKIVGLISQGKEANVYFGYDSKSMPIAIKIYKISSQSAQWKKPYILGDFRFKKIGITPEKIIDTWCQKEYRNLLDAYRNQIKCPQPLFFKGNILIMQFIGSTDGNPAPKLKDMVLETNNIQFELKTSLDFIENLYKKAKLIHSDLSEFNILYYQGSQVLIDMSQSVPITHPKAKEFLIRDIKNVIHFYSKFNIETPSPMDV
jgi:RIO kinase 1